MVHLKLLTQKNHYQSLKSLKKNKQLHAHTIISDHQSIHLRSNLATTYSSCGHIPYAHKLFDKSPDRTLETYNALIRTYVHNGLGYNALNLFVEMLESGLCNPNSYTYPFVIKACSDLSLPKTGGVIHGHTLMAGFDTDIYVQNSLLAMYMKCNEKDAAKNVFDSMEERTVISWNTMISGFSRNGFSKEALMVFNKMMDNGMEKPDCATVVSVLPVCGYLKELQTGRLVHVWVVQTGLENEITVRNALVDMYMKCGSVENARLVFDKTVGKDVVTWTSMINGYILNEDVKSALALTRLMQSEQTEPIKPNSVTIASLLSACGSSRNLNDGMCLHAWVIRQKLDSQVIVETALIDMYAKCYRVETGFRVFLRSSRTRTVPWNAIISGYVYNNLAREAIEVFKRMLTDGIEPDAATLNCLLPAYAVLADIRQTKSAHSYLIRSGIGSSVEAATALVDVYSKCGSLGSAHNIFDGIPDRRKDIVLWSVIISGYGKHGDGKTAVSLFNQMVKARVKPNEVTFASVLQACSHAGLVDEGLSLFRFMLDNHKTTPRSDHYSCMVDLLGRAGRVTEAYDLIKSMSVEPTHAVWGALLGACVIHENVVIGEVAANKLFEIEPENTGNYVLMSKIYAAVGNWKDVENVRNLMNGIGLRKIPACSLIEAR